MRCAALTLVSLCSGWAYQLTGGPPAQRRLSPRMEVTPPLPDGQHHFLAINDLTSEEVRSLLELAKKIKPLVLERSPAYRPFDTRTLAMVFTKPSTRTRVSFESGFYRLGGHALCLGEEVGIGKRESVADVSRVLASMNDVIMARLFAHADILGLAEHSSVPVINGLTDFNHPCQIIADALTVEEVLGSIEGKKVVYVGDGNNIVNSWLELACVVPFDFVCASPRSKEAQPRSQAAPAAAIHRSRSPPACHRVAWPGLAWPGLIASAASTACCLSPPPLSEASLNRLSPPLLSTALCLSPPPSAAWPGQVRLPARVRAGRRTDEGRGRGQGRHGQHHPRPRRGCEGQEPAGRLG